MNLRQHRNEVLGETLENVAMRAGVSVSVVSYVERGMPFHPRRIGALARAYRVTIGEFKRLIGHGGARSHENKRAVRNAI